MNSPTWPRLIAETLVEARPSLAGAFPPVRVASLERLRDAIEHAVQTSETPWPAPGFLRPTQHPSWYRVMVALEAHRGAILAEPLGSGKTWIALAVAAQATTGAVAVVPAVLQSQWERAAREAQVKLTLWSHERVSRGTLPPGDPGLVIIDEAHRFRNPRTRRVATLAPWLQGRKVLACTATPIVNRLEDLLTLLKLLFRADQLLWDGLRHLDELRSHSTPPPALRRLIIRTSGMEQSHPWKIRSVQSQPELSEVKRLERGAALIATLEGSSTPGVARLIRNTLLDALSSSDAALRAALVRYRTLLWQGRDAGGGSRAALRRFAGQALEQCVFWSLLPIGEETGELPQGDLPRVEEALTILPKDGSSDLGWLLPLSRILRSVTPSLCFTRHRATARLLVRHLGEAAWVDGRGAGIGCHRYPRGAVLSAFGPHRSEWQMLVHTPEILVATDVAAEWLDLQGAGALIHLDLPWTATRLRQREGRLLRSGQTHPEVLIGTRKQPPQPGALPDQIPRINRKERLATRWLATLTCAQSRHSSSGFTQEIPCVVVAAEQPHDLVALRLRGSSRDGLLLLGREQLGSWIPLAPASLPLEGRVLPVLPPPIALEEILSSAVASAMSWLRRGERSWAPALVWRVQALAREAARHRDSMALQKLDRLLAWLTRSPRLGDQLLAEQLIAASDNQLVQAEIPPIDPAPEAAPVPVAMLLYRIERRGVESTLVG